MSSASAAARPRPICRENLAIGLGQSVLPSELLVVFASRSTGDRFRRQRFPPINDVKSEGTDHGPSIDFGIVVDLSVRVKFRGFM
jgi:hypothetical protein